ncbi:MAG: hypothetical protein QOG45_2496 [Chloroflexota bacterium]|nr:hypothetical protein [Chloroflexota bacterium]
MNRSGVGAAVLTVVTALALGSPLVVDATTAVSGNPAKGWCKGVVDPGPGNGVLKELVDTPILDTAPDGTAVVTYRFRLTLIGPPFEPGRTVHVADCAVVSVPDSTPTTLSGRKSTFSTQVDLVAPFSSTVVSLTVPAAVRICDEAKVNGSGHDNRSNILCTGPAPTSSTGGVSSTPVPPPAPAPRSGVGAVHVTVPKSGSDLPLGLGLVLTACGLGALAGSRRLRRRARR